MFSFFFKAKGSRYNEGEEPQVANPWSKRRKKWISMNEVVKEHNRPSESVTVLTVASIMQHICNPFIL